MASGGQSGTYRRAWEAESVAGDAAVNPVLPREPREVRVRLRGGLEGGRRTVRKTNDEAEASEKGRTCGALAKPLACGRRWGGAGRGVGCGCE